MFTVKKFEKNCFYFIVCFKIISVKVITLQAVELSLLFVRARDVKTVLAVNCRAEVVLVDASVVTYRVATEMEAVMVAVNSIDPHVAAF